MCSIVILPLLLSSLQSYFKTETVSIYVESVMENLMKKVYSRPGLFVFQEFHRRIVRRSMNLNTYLAQEIKADSPKTRLRLDSP